MGKIRGLVITASWFLLLFLLFSCSPPAMPPPQLIETPKIPSTTSQPLVTTTPNLSSPVPTKDTSILPTPASTVPIASDVPQEQEVILPTTNPNGDAFCSGKPVLLGIPDRDEDENAPEEGWCGETSIQMALDYYGKKVSQRVINQAGKPKHPDLWEDDINVALDALSVKYEAWDEYDWDVDGFLNWIAAQLQAGYPVLLGVKIYPDEHPNWEVNHFVLVVGCDEEGIIINTNNAGEGQIHVSYEELTTNFEDGYSIINRQKYLFGRAIQGPK